MSSTIREDSPPYGVDRTGLFEAQLSQTWIRTPRQYPIAIEIRPLCFPVLCRQRADGSIRERNTYGNTVLLASLVVPSLSVTSEKQDFVLYSSRSIRVQLLDGGFEILPSLRGSVDEAEGRFALNSSDGSVPGTYQLFKGEVLGLGTILNEKALHDLG